MPNVPYDQFDAMLLCRLHYSIQSLKTIRPGIDSGRGAREGLEVYCSGARNRRNIVEAPDT